jgi:hypothetical protein
VSCHCIILYVLLLACLTLIDVVLPVRLVYFLWLAYIMLCMLGPTVDRVSSFSLSVDVYSMSCV